MSAISLVVQITIGISFASATVSPSQLYEMVDYLVDFYMNDSCLVVISSGGYTAASYVSVVYVDPYKTELHDQEANSTSEEIYKIGTIAPVLELGCTGFVVQVDNPGRQLRLVEKTFVHVNQRTQRKFIFLPAVSRVTRSPIGPQDEVLDSKNFNLREILREKSVRYIPNVIFAIPNDEEDHVALFTHRFTGPDEVYRQEMLLDTYAVAEKKFKLSASLFPDKVKDLEGRVLRVAVFHYPPSVIIDEGNDSSSLQVDGTEWRFAQEFAKLHNCSLQALVDNEGAWGFIYKNLTGKGAIGSVVEDKADFAMTTLYTQHKRTLYLDLSTHHYRSGATCLVPGPRRRPQWMSPILPFSTGLWLTFIGMTVVSAIFIGVVSGVESFIRSEDPLRMSPSEAALTVLGITLLQGLRKDPKGLGLAALSIILLIVSLLMVTAYGSSLASAMTVPRYKTAIDTISELAESGIPWAANDPAWVEPILDAEEPKIRTLVENFRQLSPAELMKHSAVGEGWAFALQRISGHYLIPDYVSPQSLGKMHLMKSDVYWGYCVTMLRKSSPFTKWYSQRVLEIQASGIPAYWQTDIVTHRMDISAQLNVDTDYSSSSGPASMTVQQLQGTFSLLAIGLALSGLAFLAELLKLG